MNVLSLFDGMGCGWIALKELGIKVDKGYSSEIDKFAIKQVKLNFPEVIHLGSVEDWQTWDINWNEIDLIMAGSPCQGFSFAGKGLAFDDPRSKLFFVFVDILNHCKKHNPGVKFLLENVDMKKEYLRIISEYVGIFPVNINSSLVSAQNRNRWYWSNIKVNKVGMFNERYTGISQPENGGIFLKDILQPEEEVEQKYYISQVALNRINRKGYSLPKFNPEKAGTLNTKNNSGQLSVDSGTTFVISDRGIGSSFIVETEKISPLSSRPKCEFDHLVKIDRSGNLKPDQLKASPLTIGGHGCDNHSDMDLLYLSNYVQWDVSGKGYKSQQDRAFYEDTKHGSLTSSRSENKTGFFFENGIIRRLTPIECARLQTIPDWYKWECSDSQIYRMLGNGWTIEVIKHILSFLEK